MPDTQSAEILYQRALQSMRQADYEQAIAGYQAVLAENPRHVPALYDMATALYATCRFNLSLDLYRYAEQLAPDSAEIASGLGACFKTRGDFTSAISYYEKALRLSPHDARHIYNLVWLKPPAPDSALGQQLRTLHASAGCTGNARVCVCFALGKVYEKLGDARLAFQYYDEANRLHYPHSGYSEAEKFALFDAMESTFSAGLFQRLKGAGTQDETPVFIVGMPRSGTSLVEQILASHSAVYGAGELTLLSHLAATVIPKLTGEPFPSALARMDTPAFRTLGEQAIAQLRGYCPQPFPRIIDKNPGNFLLAGLIHLLFPNASIIHCVRTPMDNCWSLYRQHFLAAHGYCYDQAALGRYYRRYRQLMQHWHRVLPGKIHDVQYEALVEQPETVIRSLLNHCHLPWEEGCLSFHRTERKVATASALQVRRPLYDSAIHSWEPVSAGLAPLRAALAEENSSTA